MNFLAALPLAILLVLPLASAQACTSNNTAGLCVPSSVCTQQGRTPDPNAFGCFSPTVSCCPGFKAEICITKDDGRTGFCTGTDLCLAEGGSPSKGDCGGPIFVRCCRPKFPLDGPICEYNLSRFGKVTGICSTKAVCADHLKAFSTSGITVCQAGQGCCFS